MGYTSTNELVTKARNVKLYQDVLYQMSLSPGDVQVVFLSKGAIMAKFHNGPTMQCGEIWNKYPELINAITHVKGWRLTGGVPTDHIHPKFGIAYQYIGLNLRILVLTQQSDPAHKRQVKDKRVLTKST